MNKASSNPTPVLAQLPDVSDQLSTTGPRSSRAAAGFVEYRFDPPQGNVGEDAPAGTRSTRVFRRLPRHESPILPRSDPFSFPAPSPQERLAPLVRFFAMFAVCTAVCTSLLMIARRDSSTSEPIDSQVSEPVHSPARLSAEPTATAVQQSLEPGSSEWHPPVAVPSAIGPLGATAEQNESRIADFGLRIEEPSQPAIGTPLPRVQTGDPRTGGGDTARPPAVARLPGYILEAPSLQARHDDNQSSLH